MSPTAPAPAPTPDVDADSPSASAAAALSASARAPARRFVIAFVVFVVALVGLALVFLSVGTPTYPLSEVPRVVFAGDSSPEAFTIWELRLPRLLSAAMAGAMLGISGAVVQDSLRNPLADVGLLGISSAGALVVGAIAVFSWTVPYFAQALLVLVAGLGVGAFLAVVTSTGQDTIRTILLGLALSALFGAMLLGLIVLASQQFTASLLIFRFLLGSFGAASWADVRLLLPFFAVLVPVALASGRLLNLLQLGDDVASGLGLRVVRARLLLLVLAVALAAPTVAVAGVIVFVGLLAPHPVRMFLRSSDSRLVVPLAGLVGTWILVAADFLGRTAFVPSDVSAGIWVSIVGGPAVLVLLRRTTVRQPRAT